MNVQSISLNQPNFSGKMKFNQVNVYDIDTGVLIEKLKKQELETKDVVSMTEAFMSRIYGDTKGINTLIQVMQKDNKLVYYGVKPNIAMITNAYLKTKDSDEILKF